MANDFVNTITTSNGTTYDVQDKRLTVTAADAGKVVSVDSNGNLSLVNPSGGTQLYEHILNLIGDNYYKIIVVVNASPTPVTLDTFDYQVILNSFNAWETTMNRKVVSAHANGSKHKLVGFVITDSGIAELAPDYPVITEFFDTVRPL